MNASKEPPTCEDCGKYVCVDDVQVTVPCDECGGSHKYHFACALDMLAEKLTSERVVV